jgi:hypothetical protein
LSEREKDLTFFNVQMRKEKILFDPFRVAILNRCAMAKKNRVVANCPYEEMMLVGETLAQEA